MKPQPVILDVVPAHARHVYFDLKPSANPAATLRALAAACDGRSSVQGDRAGGHTGAWRDDFWFARVSRDDR